MNKLVRASAHFRDTMGGDTIEWHPERARREVTSLPKIGPPIIRAGMSAVDRQQLQTIAERVNMTYSSYTLKSKAMDDLVAWVENYRKAGDGRA